MKKFLKTLFLVALVLILLPNIASAQSPIRIWMNGNYIQTDVEPFLENGRTLVPVRVISENLGYTVDWNNEEQIVSIFSVDGSAKITKFIMLGIDQTDALILNADYMNRVINSSEEVKDDEFKQNSTIKALDVAPKLTNSRTFVPIRFIAEEFNVKVDWDPENFTVLIGDTSNYVPIILNPPTETTQINTFANTNQVSYSGGTYEGQVPVSEAKYIGNIKSMKYHYANCREVSKMNPENKAGFNDVTLLQKHGFVPCKVCH